MCGILGLLAPSGSVHAVAAAATELAHRGPDDAGVYSTAGFSMGVRRLAIIDIEGGHQPLGNEDGSVWAAHNGEIFNAPELRVELEARGHRFRTRSDAEILPHGWEEWGERLPAHLRGMFAFAIWDERRRSLLLAQDRFGMKPLFLARAGERLAFASEMSPLFALLPDLSREPDPVGLPRCVSFGFVAAPRSVFKGIRKLAPAHTLLVENGAVRERRYWRLERPRRGEHDLVGARATSERFVELLDDAVRRWTLADVPLGSLLSGGVDSASIAALLRRNGADPLHTFTVGFGDLGFDESGPARATSRTLGTEHHEVRLEHPEVDDLPSCLRHIEEPRHSLVHMALWILFRSCRAAGFKAVMTGEGSDELLGGYTWYQGERLFEALVGLPAPLRRLLSRMPIEVPGLARTMLAEGVADPIARYGLWHMWRFGVAYPNLTTFPIPRADREWPEQYGGEAADLHPFDQIAFVEQHTRLPHFINHGVDRMSMAHGIEARTPFLDHHLWEMAARIPPRFKLSLGGDKLPLRRGMRGLLPRRIRYRGKLGLSVMLSEWWRRDRFPGWAETALSARELERAGYFRSDVVATMLQAHRAGAFYTMPLTAVLTTQLWHRRFVDRQDW